jgi:general secretion pathway protein D
MRTAKQIVLTLLAAMALQASPAHAETRPGKVAPAHRTLSDEERKTARFHMDFDKVEIEEVVRYIAEWTGKNFILPGNVHGSITIIGPTDVSADEAFAAFVAALRANNLTVVPTGRFLKIVTLESLR